MKIDRTIMSLSALAHRLKISREVKGLSQRALSERIGVPQSHISKIENGKVDMQVTSLLELTRGLGLEVVLVPQGKLSAVEAILRSDARPGQTPLPAYRIDDDDSEWSDGRFFGDGSGDGSVRGSGRGFGDGNGEG
jgi:transcriptional regulator with XRE-family HTH domain